MEAKSVEQLPAGAPHVVVFFRQPEKEKTQANDRPDDREVVQQQMEMCEVQGARL